MDLNIYKIGGIRKVGKRTLTLQRPISSALSTAVPLLRYPKEYKNAK